MGNRFIVVGIILLALGVQFRLVDSIVLNQQASQFVETRIQRARMRTNPYGRYNSYDPMMMNMGTVAKKSIQPPRWAGWALISGGVVMLLHGVSTRRP